MDLMSKYQGVIKGVFANENSGSNEDSYVERLLDRISNGKLAEDRRTAMVELQSVVAESRAAQLAFGAMGFPVLLGVLKEERDDVEMVRGSLETFVGALTPIGHGKGPNEVEPALMNSDLLSREVDSISLLLSLLSEEDFYVRYYTLQLLTALLTNSPNRLQEAILTIPRGITRLMDMLMDREVIRNEALLLLTYLTREAEEIQKIVVFEGAFEKIFSIIKEEGGSEGGVVVQDSIELLNNLLRNNSSNQVLLRETIGFEPLVSILKLRGSSYKFTQQKTVNLLSVLETINLLIKGGSECVTNKTILVQRKLLDHLLMMGVESQWAPVAVRCGALHCIGDLVNGHSQNRDVLASKLLGEDPQIELALNSLLRIILRTSSVQEFISADYVFKTFCEKNPIGQTMLASTLIPQPHLMTHAPLEEDVNMSFGSMLLHGLTMSENNGDLETCCRAASVLSHIMKDNLQCKERVLKIEIESPTPSLENSEPLMHRMVKYLALASSSTKGKEVKSLEVTYIQPIILKLLIIWLSNCPNAVKIFLNSRPHLTYLLELVNNSSTTVCVRGLSAILLGECVIFNQNNALSIADAITQKIGVTLYFLKLEELQKSFLFKPKLDKKSLSRSASASTVEIEDDENEKNEDHPILGFVFDSEFVSFVKELEGYIREKILDVYSNVNCQVAVLPSELEQKKDENESDHDYIKRLKLFIEKQCVEIQELLSRNAAFAEELVKTGGDGSGKVKTGGTGGDGLEKVQIEKLKGEVLEASKKLETVNNEKMRIEADLKSLSDAYNSLEQANFQLEKEVKSLKDGGVTPPGYGGVLPEIDIEKIKEEAREEAQKESEVELSDLLVCLGQEQTKVERLMSKLIELGVDADELLDGIGDENALPEDDDDEEED